MKKNITGIVVVVLLFSVNVYGESLNERWVQRVLALQMDLDRTEPLGRSTFLYTHNSYNSAAYANAGRYWDPNHQLSITEQLNLGVRALELDVHWTLGAKAKKELLLCHGTSKHLGCSLFDRPLSEALSEIRQWLLLPEHQRQVLMIYLEDAMEGRYGEAIQVIHDSIGEWVYRPQRCEPLPLEVTKQALLNQGKRVLLVGGDCGSPAWSQWVFKGHWPTKNNSFKGFPECTVDGLSADQVANRLVRIYEDATWLSRHFGSPPPSIDEKRMQAATACGLGLVGVEPLLSDDARLRAAIWSWAEGEPLDNEGKNCAVLNTDGRFQADNCSEYRAFACRHAQRDHWTISFSKGPWSEGGELCRSEFGEAYQFDVPRSGAQKEKVFKASQGQLLWLNYIKEPGNKAWMIP